MKIFLDTIEIAEIKKYSAFGLVDGITTNPSLMSKATKNFTEVAREICELVTGDVSLEVAAEDYETMIDEGKKIASIGKNVVIKLPMTWNGVQACRYFADKGIGVNMTLCFTPVQALIAARAGAKYISPFIGRLDDTGEDGISLIADIRDIYDNYGLKTNILAASVRNIAHVTNSALCGADYITIPAKLMEQLLEHDLTNKGLEIFRKDWVKSGKKI